MNKDGGAHWQPALWMLDFWRPHTDVGSLETVLQKGLGVLGV